MRNFDTFWAEEISEALGTDEFQTLTVELWDTSIQPEYDIETGEYNYPENAPIVYSGQASVIFPRWGVFSGGEGQSNAKTNNVARVKLPRFAVGIVSRGWRFKIIESPENPALLGRWLTITTDSQGSSAVNRVFECSWDSDQQPAEAP